MKCPQCGTANPEANSKCFRCGSVLVALSEAETFAGISLPPTAAKEQDTVAAGAQPVSAAASPTPASELPTAGPWAVTGVAAPAPEQISFGPRYRIERLLGQGGMGAVYQAYDKELDRTVALKLVRPGLAVDPLTSQRFKQELLLASKITHKNVLRIHDLGDAAGVKFISMAYVQGQDLHALLQQHGKLPVERAVRLAKQMCAALAAAHAEGVAHRDFKPQNILLDQNDQVYVSDFGLAKSLEEDTGMTRSGEFLGTPRYMAPEQVEGKKADQRIDLYALGLILYEMVTGDVPFHADTTIQLLYKRVHEQPKSPKTLNPELPDWLVAVIMKCLERDPDRRYQSAEEVLQDLNKGTAPAGSRTVVVSLPTVSWKMSRARLWLLGGGLLLLLIAAGAVLLRRSRSPAAPPRGKAVSVLVADFVNHTGDPIFDGTLEPMLNVALEGASFINAFSRGDARKLAEKLPHSTDKLDEQTARLIAISQNVGAVVTGSLSQRGDGYKLSVEAVDTVTGNTIASADVSASSKDALLLDVPKLAVPIRKALGDSTPESVQLAATQGSFVTSNLEAVHQYGIGMEEQFSGKMQEALQSFSKAAELDPNFARAYSGMAAASRNLGRRQDAENYIKLAMEHVDRMTERERFRLRGTYYVVSGNWQKCIEEYSALVKQYPVDNIGHSNLAYCYSNVPNMAKAVEEQRLAVQLSPTAAPSRMNLSLYATYAGDFQTGEQEARAVLKLNPTYEKGYLALAYAQLGQGQLDQAAATYQDLEKISQLGSSYAAAGLADLGLYRGQFAEAARILREGTASDIAAQRPNLASAKYAALAYTALLRDQKAQALAPIQQALANGKGAQLQFLAARLYVAAGESSKARQLAAGLASEVTPEPQAYAKLIEGEIALQEKKPNAAIKAFTDAGNVVDSWIGRFDLGRAYLDAGLFVEADSEFDRCLKRRGEAMELFLSDMPTYSYVVPVYYFQGRVREGLKSPGFADSYRSYVSLRGQAGEDPLLAEIRRRLGQ